MAIKVNDLKRGQVIHVDNDDWIVVDMEHVKPGKGPALYHLKLKNLRQGSVLSKRMGPSDTVDVIFTQRREMEYLYQDGPMHVFMDTETYEQTEMSEDLVGDALPYLKDNAVATVMFANGKPVIIDLPAAVELKITETEAAVKGDTATNVTKRAVTETNLEVKVPIHIREGDTIRVDTRTGEFLGRVKGD